jgi:hypothetical protein
VEHFSNLSLSQDYCLVVLFDKEELCDNSLIIPLAQLSNQHDASNLKSKISATNKHIVTIGSIKEEMRLVFPLNTLCYIEFNDLCNRNNLKEKLLCVMICHCYLEISFMLLDNTIMKENI